MLKLFRSVARFGELDLNPDVNDEASPIDIAISRVIVHHQFSTQSTVNDIALLKLEKKVTFGGKFFILFFYYKL